MAEQKSIEGYTFRISVRVALMCLFAILAAGWQGSSWYNGIMFGQQTNTTLILTRFEDLAREQRSINKQQSDSLKVAYMKTQRQDTINMRNSTINQTQVDINRQTDRRLAKLEFQ